MTSADTLNDLWERAGSRRSRADLAHGLIVTCDRTGPRIVVELARHNGAPNGAELALVRSALQIPREAPRESDRRNGYHIERFTWENPDPPQPALSLDLSPISNPDGRPEAADSPDDDSIDARFQRFDTANPHVYRSLVALAFRLYSSGCKRFGVKLLIEELRWNYALATAGDEFKLDNRFTSRYSRKMTAEYPELREVIEQRALRS